VRTARAPEKAADSQALGHFQHIELNRDHIETLPL
jgi:hypothetical protein